MWPFHLNLLELFRFFFGLWASLFGCFDINWIKLFELNFSIFSQMLVGLVKANEFIIFIGWFLDFDSVICSQFLLIDLTFSFFSLFT